MVIVVAFVSVKGGESHDQTDGSENEYEQVAKYCQDDEKDNKCCNVSEARQRSRLGMGCFRHIRNVLIAFDAAKIINRG